MAQVAVTPAGCINTARSDSDHVSSQASLMSAGVQIVDTLNAVAQYLSNIKVVPCLT